jgi:hypothetical protein
MRGYTIMELLITMALAAALLGLGAGAFMTMGKTTAYREILRSSASLVSKARNASSRMPAAVVLDADARMIYGRTEQTLQELHFEPRPSDDEEGGGLTVDYLGGQLTPDGGRVGGGMQLAGGGINCKDYPAYDVTDGLSLELWVQPERLGSGYLVSKGDAFSIRLVASTRGESQLQVKIGLTDKGMGEELAGSVSIPDLRAGEWFGVLLTYDLTEAVLSTDHGYGPIVRARWPETRKLKPDHDADLMVGGDVIGVVDDFRFSGVHVEEPLRLPDGVEIDGPGRTIHFRAGKLDSRMHTGIEQVRLRQGAMVTVLEIGQSGTVQDVYHPDPETGEKPPEEERSASEKEE